MALYVSCMYFRYSYDPFQQSLNDNPEYELPLSAGDYVLIWGNVDDVSIYIMMILRYLFLTLKLDNMGLCLNLISVCPS